MVNPKETVDSDGDGYGDNRDAFPTDPTQHIDKDEDGFGDNIEGNNPDFYPDDPGEHAKSEKKDVDEFQDMYLWIAIAVFIVVDVIIITFILLKRKKPAK